MATLKKITVVHEKYVSSFEMLDFHYNIHDNNYNKKENTLLN